MSTQEQESQQEAGARGRRRPPALVWALGVSVLVHALGGAPFLLWEFAPRGQGLDAHWVERFEELEAIGHGRDSGRWATVDANQLPAQSAEAPQEVEPEVEAEPEPEPEVVAEPEKPPEPEPEPEPKVEERKEEIAALAPRPTPAPKPDKEAADDTKPRQTDKPQENSKQLDENTKNSKVFAADKPMPGLDRAGPTQIADMRHYGPGNARVTALVRLDRVRGTLYEEEVRRVMQKVPDFRILAEHTDFDPIDGIDSFFMASARPQYLQESFLAVRHHQSDEAIKAVLDGRFREPIPWEQRGESWVRNLVPATSGYQDPRRILLARPGLVVVGKEAWLEEISADLSADSPLREHAGQGAGALSAGAVEAHATMLDGLMQIERVADDGETLAMLSAQGLVYIIPGLGRMTFEGVRLKLSNPASPTLDLDLKFNDAQEASRFSQACPAMRARMKRALGLDGLAGVALRAMGLGDIIDKLQCRAEQEYVNVHAVFTAQQLQSIARLGATFMPQPAALYQLPPAPVAEDRGQKAEDSDSEDAMPSASAPPAVDEDAGTEPVRGSDVGDGAGVDADVGESE